MNPYKEYVQQISQNLQIAKDFPLCIADFPNLEPKKEDSPIALVFSPHPDDECITGGLSLRLLRETNFRIINVPITFGSDPERRQPRREELVNACRYLGFEIKFISGNGFEQITPKGRKEDPQNWAIAVNEVKKLLEELDPKICFFPHQKDLHPEHCGTSLLALDALSQMPSDFTCVTVEAEYWQAMEKPNLMVEFDDEIVSGLVTALTFHIGEVQRNPYHLSLPAWLIDNVRRGSEILGSLGAKSQDYTFAGLYRVSLLSQGKLDSAFKENRFISANENLESTFESILKSQ
jgi:LmbE family N-acetylglucosaminyl deacetylase